MKSVTITLQDDGTFTVAGEGEEAGQPFDNAEDAMNAAMEMLRGPVEEEDAAEAMAGGYEKVAGNRMQPNSVGALFGEE